MQHEPPQINPPQTSNTCPPPKPSGRFSGLLSRLKKKQDTPEVSPKPPTESLPVSIEETVLEEHAVSPPVVQPMKTHHSIPSKVLEIPTYDESAIKERTSTVCFRRDLENKTLPTTNTAAVLDPQFQSLINTSRNQQEQGVLGSSTAVLDSTRADIESEKLLSTFEDSLDSHHLKKEVDHTENAQTLPRADGHELDIAHQDENDFEEGELMDAEEGELIEDEGVIPTLAESLEIEYDSSAAFTGDYDIYADMDVDPSAKVLGKRKLENTDAFQDLQPSQPPVQPPQKKQKQDNKQMICFSCNQPGHHFKKCLAKDVTCYACFQKGASGGIAALSDAEKQGGQIERQDLSSETSVQHVSQESQPQEPSLAPLLSMPPPPPLTSLAPQPSNISHSEANRVTQAGTLERSSTPPSLPFALDAVGAVVEEGGKKEIVPQQGSTSPKQQASPTNVKVKTCHKCGQQGHIQKYCKSGHQSQQASPKQGVAGVTCHNCLQQGHYQKDCPRRNSQNSQPSVSSNPAPVVPTGILAGPLEQLLLSNDPSLKETTLFKVFGTAMPTVLKEIQEIAAAKSGLPHIDPAVGSPKIQNNQNTLSRRQKKQQNKVQQKNQHNKQQEQQPSISRKNFQNPQQPLSSDQTLRATPCRHFPAGKCWQGDACPYSHDPQDFPPGTLKQNSINHRAPNSNNTPLQLPSSQKPLDTTPCQHYPLGKCWKGDSCRYSHNPDHYPPDLRQKVLSVTTQKSAPLCKFVRPSGENKCQKPNCQFSHDVSKEPCAFFHLIPTGCQKGNVCPFSHAAISFEEKKRMQEEHFEFKEKKRRLEESMKQKQLARQSASTFGATATDGGLDISTMLEKLNETAPSFDTSTPSWLHQMDEGIDSLEAKSQYQPIPPSYSPFSASSIYSPSSAMLSSSTSTSSASAPHIPPTSSANDYWRAPKRDDLANLLALLPGVKSIVPRNAEHIETEDSSSGGARNDGRASSDGQGGGNAAFSSTENGLNSSTATSPDSWPNFFASSMPETASRYPQSDYSQETSKPYTPPSVSAHGQVDVAGLLKSL
ncbi:hypothetical protein HDV05_005186 [Chytridiales sp. JEL 0842]|nr:hypothetical protein HDV05_005186 [Chytridiales sp. JEL 0842]